MASMIIVRGLPGSGKSTFAQETLEKSPELVWVEADQFFTDSNGVYVFAPAKIKEAHTWCQDKVRAAVLKGKDVLVSNTFSQIWEMQPYIDMAEQNSMRLNVIVIYRANLYPNVHGVPEEIIKRMKERWQCHPKDIIWTV